MIETMNRRYLAFDIEIAKVLPEEVTDLKAHRPLGICCAATLADGDRQSRLWYSRGDDEKPSPQMSRDDLSEMVDFLAEQVAAGCTIATWNGLGFDFDILAEESARRDDCRRLALDHVDMMFHVFCEKGFPVSLDAAAKGIGTRGKFQDMDAAIVPQLWAAGKTQQVLEYVARDAAITLEVATVNQKQGLFQWITRRGSPSEFKLPSGWLPVHGAMKLPKPDTSWMTSPAWPREKFTGWLS